MTKEEIIAELEIVDEELMTVLARFTLAMRMTDISSMNEVKEEVYRQGHRVAQLVRDSSGEMELVGGIENSMHWLEHATRYQMGSTGSWHVEKIVNSIKSLLMKARTRGLDPMIQISMVTEKDNPLSGELEKAKAELDVTNKELVRAREENQELKDRPVKLPPKEDMNVKWAYLNLPRWMLTQLSVAYIVEIALAISVVIKFLLLLFNQNPSQPVKVPMIMEKPVDTGAIGIIDGQRPGTKGK